MTRPQSPDLAAEVEMREQAAEKIAGLEAHNKLLSDLLTSALETIGDLNANGRTMNAECDRMRPVYEAAIAWRVGRDRNIVGTAPSGGQRKATGVALIVAIDRAVKP